MFTLCVHISVETQAQVPDKPLLYSQSTSTRAIALDALSLNPEPFSPSSSSSFWFGAADRPRIILFARALAVDPADVSAITADAEDASHRHYALTVEDVSPVPGQPWLSQIVVSFTEKVDDVGDVLIGISYLSTASNRVRIGIGHVGGGPPDDVGALPTPAPPYTIAGRITSGTAGLGGAKVRLSGPQTLIATADSTGAYLFTVTTVGNYTISLAEDFYDVTPVNRTLIEVNGNRLAQDFTATRRQHTISGRIQGDQNNNLGNLGVTLSSNADNFQPQTIYTSSDGLFSFTNLPAGYRYTVTPAQTNLYLFSSQSEEVLDSDVSFSFNGTRRHYTISGVVANPSNQGATGVIVSLSGAVNSSVTTGISGSYSFPNLPAGFTYTLNLTKSDFIFEPASQTYELLQDERRDFTAIRVYRISGRVTDSNGNGIFGITMAASGAEQHRVTTTSDGSYSLTLRTLGNYFVVPSKEQDFYQFTPETRFFSNISNNPTANFTGSFSSTSTPGYVLEFDGTPMTVDYGDFWPTNVGLGHFFWEFWAMPGQMLSTRYLVSDGYGGTHALLFGFSYNDAENRYSLNGNIWTGSTWVFFNSDDGPGVNEWGHYAVGWDGSSIITYYDGVPAGKQTFTGPRICMGRGWGAGMPLLGGSDHQNLIGRIAQVRAYEGSNPRAVAPEASFAPQTLFSLEGQLLSYFFRPAQTVADLSSGYQSIPHSGRLRGFDPYYIVDCPTCPTPKYVIDPTAPNFASFGEPGTITTPANPAPPTPAGAVIFDSFSRSNATYILGSNGGLANTEAGSAGPKTWQSGVHSGLDQPFGILGGRAVLLANQTSLAWIATGSKPDLEIRVDRRQAQFGSGRNTGVCFRVVDKDNFFFAYTSDGNGTPGALNTLTVGYYQAGIRTNIINDLPLTADTWQTLRVITRQSGAIDIYAHDTVLYSTTSSAFATATGAGLYNNGPGLGLTNRWDNFTVLNVQ